MLRNKNFYLRGLAMLLLVGGIFGSVMASGVHAAPFKNPAQQATISDTPTGSITAGTPTTETPTVETPTVQTPTIQTPTVSTPTESPTLVVTPPTRTRTPSPTPSAPHHIVISEFRTIGPLGANDEFIELYNPTGSPVNIGGWSISASSGCGSSLSTLVYIYIGTVLQPGQHYLVAAFDNYSSISNADQKFLPGIADNGGIALISSGNVVDMVGMCTTTYFYEGTPLPPLPVAPLVGTLTPVPGTSNQSYERKPGGNTSCYDTANNVNDFKLISPADPQNRVNPAVMCPGVFLTSPTRTGTKTRTPTRTPTRPPTAFPAYAILNEFLPHPQNDWNADGVANVGDEYIEVINLGYIDLNMKGWKLDTGINGPTSFTVPDTLLKSRGIAVFFGSETGISLSDGGGTVRLIRTDGRIFDAFTYPAVEVPERTWCRLPDGSDRWGFDCRPSPGRPNISITESNSGPGSAAGENPACPQINTAPQSLVIAECGGFGAGITDNPLERIFWLQNHWKWDVFVK